MLIQQIQKIKKNILKASQEQDNGGIGKIVDMSISIYNDKIISDISMMTNDNHKSINEEIKCTDKIQYMVLMKVMCCLLKCVRKKRMKIVKKKEKRKRWLY